MNAKGREIVRWAFTPIPHAATQARRKLAGQLRAWGISTADAEPVLLVAYELVANAVEHARTALELAVSFDDTAVVVEVSDESPREPQLQPFHLAAVRGRGLQMVAALSKSWNWVRRGGGKTIRAVIVPGLRIVALLACVANWALATCAAGFPRSGWQPA
jgi:anti-sigma regulatory factor (Ser/Thr protein kinase)